jgi:hypothetical protein
MEDAISFSLNNINIQGEGNGVCLKIVHLRPCSNPLSMQVYTLSRSWKYFIYLLSLLIIAGAVGGTIWWLLSPDDHSSPALVIPFILLFIAGSVWMAQEARIGQVIIGPDFIQIKGTVINRELLFTQIKGFRVDKNYIRFFPNTIDLKRISISTYIGHSADIHAWAQAHFPDLDLQEAAENLQAALEDNRYSHLSEEERTVLLKRAVLVTRIIQGLSVVSAIAVYFFGSSAMGIYALLILIAIPWIAIGAMYYYKGLITINAKKDSLLPSLEFAFFPAAFALFLLALTSLKVLHLEHMWMPFAAIIFLAGLLLWRVGSQGAFNPGNLAVPRTVATYLVILAVYSYGAVIMINCYFDRTPATYYEVTVINKRISKGKTTTYYLELAPWGPVTGNDEVQVSKAFYNKMPVDKSVALYLRTGLLDIPWYFVDESLEPGN